MAESVTTSESKNEACDTPPHHISSPRTKLACTFKTSAALSESDKAWPCLLHNVLAEPRLIAALPHASIPRTWANSS
jgi:hypothetical protein